MNFNNIKLKIMLWYVLISFTIFFTIVFSIFYIFNDSMYNTLEELEEILFFIVPIIFIIFTIANWYIINNILNKVKKVNDEVKSIKSDDFSKRLTLNNSNDEIDELIGTFNFMLNQAEESFNKIKRFSSDVSHEFKTPLTIIIGEIELVLQKQRDVNEYEDVLKSIYEQSKSLDKLIESLLLLANNKDFNQKLTLLNLDDIILDIISSYKNVKDKQINFNFIQFDNVKIKVDKNLIDIMIKNIINNAIKYSKDDIQIDISLNKNKLIIKDYGTGIKKDDIKYIFDEFYRCDKSRTTSGYGLGLSIVKNIINLHEFKITIDSEINKYTKITILFN